MTALRSKNRLGHIIMTVHRSGFFRTIRVMYLPGWFFILWLAVFLPANPLFAAPEVGASVVQADAAGVVAGKKESAKAADGAEKATGIAGTSAEEPIDLLSEGLEVAGYLLLLMVFAAVVIRLGKRLQPNMGASGLIRIEDGHNLAPGVGVRLIRVGSRAWLIGVTRERVSLLAELSREEMESAKERAST